MAVHTFNDRLLGWLLVHVYCLPRHKLTDESTRFYGWKIQTFSVFFKNKNRIQDLQRNTPFFSPSFGVFVTKSAPKLVAVHIFKDRLLDWIVNTCVLFTKVKVDLREYQIPRVEN